MVKVLSGFHILEGENPTLFSFLYRSKICDLINGLKLILNGAPALVAWRWSPFLRLQLLNLGVEWWKMLTASKFDGILQLDLTTDCLPATLIKIFWQ